MTDSRKVFSLVGQNLKLNSKADIQPHLDELDKVADLEEIHLGGNTFGVEACQALADVLKTKHTLKVADFADIFTGRLISEIPDALRALCDALIDHTSLVELNLSDNAFGGRSAEPMVNFIKNNHSFSVLKLNNNGLGITGGTIVAEALLEAADVLKSKGLKSRLRTVICGRNRLENGSAPVWAKAFAAHSGLVEVRMFQNGIRMEGIEAISKGLAFCPNLEVLDLQDNTATVRGSRAIAACLPLWPKLKTLNLSDCLLKPKGGALLFAALSVGTNRNMETLQVQYCDLDRRALAQLGSAIQANLPNLTRLEINGNWADEDDECIDKIKSALASHAHESALDELDEMDPEGEDDDDDEDSGDDDEEPDSDNEVSRSIPSAAAASFDKSQPDDTARLVDALANTHVDDDEHNRGVVSATSTDAVEQLTEIRRSDQTQMIEPTQSNFKDAHTASSRAVLDEPQTIKQGPVPRTSYLDDEHAALPEVLSATPPKFDTTESAPDQNKPADLCGELFIKPHNASPLAHGQSAGSARKERRGFRAAWGAVRELLR